MELQNLHPLTQGTKSKDSQLVWAVLSLPVLELEEKPFLHSFQQAQHNKPLHKEETFGSQSPVPASADAQPGKHQCCGPCTSQASW